MGNRKTAALFSVALVLAILSSAVLAAPPDFTNAAYGSENQLALWGSCGQCVWYAWGRAYEVTGVRFPLVSGRSSGKYWYENGKNAGLPVGPLPAADSIAVWGGAEYDYGHVAYVESVRGDVITISEANYTW